MCGSACSKISQNELEKMIEKRYQRRIKKSKETKESNLSVCVQETLTLIKLTRRKKAVQAKKFKTVFTKNEISQDSFNRAAPPKHGQHYMIKSSYNSGISRKKKSRKGRIESSYATSKASNAASSSFRIHNSCSINSKRISELVEMSDKSLKKVKGFFCQEMKESGKSGFLKNKNGVILKMNSFQLKPKFKPGVVKNRKGSHTINRNAFLLKDKLRKVPSVNILTKQNKDKNSDKIFEKSLKKNFEKKKSVKSKFFSSTKFRLRSKVNLPDVLQKTHKAGNTKAEMVKRKSMGRISLVVKRRNKGKKEQKIGTESPIKLNQQGDHKVHIWDNDERNQGKLTDAIEPNSTNLSPLRVEARNKSWFFRDFKRTKSQFFKSRDKSEEERRREMELSSYENEDGDSSIVC